MCIPCASFLDAYQISYEGGGVPVVFVPRFLYLSIHDGGGHLDVKLCISLTLFFTWSTLFHNLFIANVLLTIEWMTTVPKGSDDRRRPCAPPPPCFLHSGGRHFSSFSHVAPPPRQQLLHAEDPPALSILLLLNPLTFSLTYYQCWSSRFRIFSSV